ncbi:MAG: helix-turn-helix domain-containing protein [Solirubrobacteraceae bacterium]|nr:helix-turn-helix domain-containing protein [Solirubrobacteraceae bacterium]
MTTSPVTEDGIRACAARASDRIDELNDALVAALGREVPEFLDDELADETRASSRGNVEAMLSVFRGETTAADVPLPPVVVSFALALARRRLPMDRLVQSYRVGQALFQRRWMDELAATVEDRDLLVAALHRSADELNVYLNRVVAAVVVEYERERERWVRGAVARRTELVDRLLRGDPAPPDAERQLGHDLRAPQTALIAWSPPSGDADHQLEVLERTVHQVAAACGVGRPLVLPVGTSSVWAWLSGDDAGDRRAMADAVERRPAPEVLLSCGGTHAGPDGFRVTHEEAARAHRVAQRMPQPAPLTRYDRVATVALLSADDDEAREFVTRALGDLAARNASTERLRETLRVFLEEGGSTRRTAERLFTHRNTVLYRLQRARTLLGRDLDAHRLEVELALLLEHTFGSRVLPGGGPDRGRS